MREYILLLPIIFIFHDMEEIAGFIWFFKRNTYLFDRFPKVMNTYRGMTHVGFALAVYEEFIPFFGVSLLAYYFSSNILNALWFGIFMSLTGHFFIHIGHTIYIKKYIPCVITSSVCLPISILILIKCATLMNWDAVSIISVIMAIIFMIVNMKIAHGLAHIVNRKILLDETQSKPLPAP
ncbi:MAG: HXXEE domain-containing protein [Lachnospiraceae bacterium]|nr:HXXEE domain-containing protein [Lachnospiraceae bacterium]